jgi:hypothetical protein
MEEIETRFACLQLLRRRRCRLPHRRHNRPRLRGCLGRRRGVPSTIESTGVRIYRNRERIEDPLPIATRPRNYNSRSAGISLTHSSRAHESMNLIPL